eukprot:scaffold277108_cov19-Tisochrysis_lutea.AAC.2
MQPQIICATYQALRSLMVPIICPLSACSGVFLVPRWICSDGAGDSPGGFKCEWKEAATGVVIRTFVCQWGGWLKNAVPGRATSIIVLCRSCRSAMKDGKIIIGSHGGLN